TALAPNLGGDGRDGAVAVPLAGGVGGGDVRPFFLCQLELLGGPQPRLLEVGFVPALKEALGLGVVDLLRRLHGVDAGDLRLALLLRGGADLRAGGAVFLGLETSNRAGVLLECPERARRRVVLVGEGVLLSDRLGARVR